MSKILNIFLELQTVILILQMMITQSTVLDKIPSKYISDSSFVLKALKAFSPKLKFYSSPKGHGKECTKANPCKIKEGISKLKPGAQLFLRGGVYDVVEGLSIDIKGNSNNYIVISSYPGEKATITSSCNKSGHKSCKEVTLFNFEKNSGYIIIENLIFSNSIADNLQGIVFYGGGQNHIIIRDNVFDSLKTTKNKSDGYEANAILLEGEGKTVESAIKNIIIYHNKVINNVLGYSEAISIAGNCENIYVLNNTLKTNTNIGIDFNGNTNACHTSNLDQPRKSVAIFNYVEKSRASYADNAGIYADGARDIYIYGNTVVDSPFGIEVGCEELKHRNPITNIVVENNNLIGNKVTGIRVGGYKENLLSVKSTEFKNNKISKSETPIIIAKVDGITFKENEIIGGKKYFIFMEFSEEYTKNLKFIKNKFVGSCKIKIYGKLEYNLNQFINSKFNTNK